MVLSQTSERSSAGGSSHSPPQGPPLSEPERVLSRPSALSSWRPRNPSTNARHASRLPQGDRRAPAAVGSSCAAAGAAEAEALGACWGVSRAAAARAAPEAHSTSKSTQQLPCSLQVALHRQSFAASYPAQPQAAQLDTGEPLSPSGGASSKAGSTLGCGNQRGFSAASSGRAAAGGGGLGILRRWLQDAAPTITASETAASRAHLQLTQQLPTARLPVARPSGAAAPSPPVSAGRPLTKSS